MTFLTKVGSFNPPASTSSQAITGVGFKPKAIIFWQSGVTSANSWQNGNAQMGIGFGGTSGASNTTGYMCYASKNGTLPEVCSSRLGTGVIGIYDYNGGALNEATLTSFDNDGFTLGWTISYNAAFTVHYLAIAGTDFTNAKVVTHNQKTSTGTLAVTGVGFKPDCVFHVSAFSNSAPSHTETFAYPSFGVMDSAGNQWADWSFDIPGSSPTATGRIQLTDACLVSTTGGGTVNTKAAFSSMDNDGFTLNWLAETGVSNYCLSLCLKGGKYNVGSWAKTTGGSGSYDSIATAFTPAAVFTSSGSNTVSSSYATGFRQMFGASDGDAQGVAGLTVKNSSVTNGLTYKHSYNERALLISNNDTGTTEAYGNIIAHPTVVSSQLSSPNINQGVCSDGTYYYCTTTTGLYKYNSAWSLVASNANAATNCGASITHLGDIKYYNGKIYVTAAADDGSYGFMNQRIALFNASDLSYSSYIALSEMTGANPTFEEPSGVAIDSANNLIWVSNFWASTNKIWKYNLATGAYVGYISPSPAVQYIQGLEYYKGSLYISRCVSTGDLSGSIVKMSTSGTGQTTVIPHIGGAYVNFEMEGIFIDSRGLSLLVSYGDLGYGLVYTFGVDGGLTAWWWTNNAVATQICYVAFGGSDASFDGVTAPTTNCTANVPLVGVKVLAPTPSDENCTANAPLVGVKVLGVQATAESFTAVSPLAGVGVLGVTATAESCTANVPTINVGTAPPTATAESFTAVVPLVGVTVPGVVASAVTCSANVPSVVIDAVLVGVTASTVTCTANVPNTVIDVTITAVAATESFTGIVPLIGVGTFGATATESFTGVVPNVLIGVNVEGVTATATFTAVAPAIGDDVNVIAVTALATFTAEVPIVSIDAVLIGVAANATFTANVPPVIYDVLIPCVTAATDTFTGHSGLISVGTFGATAIASFTMGLAGVENVTAYAFEYDVLVTYEDYIVHASEIDAGTSVLNVGEQMPLVSYDMVGDTVASLEADEIASAILDEYYDSEAVYNEDATLSPDEAYDANMISHEPPTLRPGPVAETITLLTDEDGEVV